MRSDEKLTITFWIYGLFDTCENGIVHDCDRCIKEAVDRGFNCIRMESGAGLFAKPDGTPIDKVMLRRPFGRFSPMIRQMDYIAQDGEFDVRARLLEFFRAADKHGVRIVLSSWFYLHTNWYLGEEINAPLFDLPTDEKITYFGEELDRILTFLRENNLLHCVAFAEIFNEFDGLPFAGEYDPTALSAEEADHLRAVHEAAIDRLREHHPDVLFAYDSAVADMREDLIPRNIDVLNFHNYYLWNVYQAFEKGAIINEATEPDLSPETAYFLRMKVTTAETAAEMGETIRTGAGWARRVRIYADIDPEKLGELEALLEKELAEKYDVFHDKLTRKTAMAVDVRDRIVPHAKLVMGEGVSYCASQVLRFEENSDLFWKLIGEQMKLLRGYDFYGTVVKTNCGPEDASWKLCPERYVKANALFIGE